MSEQKWVVLDEVEGEFKAEMLRGLLEAQGIQAIVSQEGLGQVFSVTIGAIGRAQILVPSNSIEQARQVLAEYYAGEFEQPEEGSDDQEPGEESGMPPSGY